MSKFLSFFSAVFWRMVLHVLFVLNFARFCLILLFDDLTVQAAHLPDPAAPAPTLEENVSNDKVDVIAPTSCTIAERSALEAEETHRADHTCPRPPYPDNHRDIGAPMPNISEQPSPDDGSPRDQLRSAVPCWDLDDESDDVSACSTSSTSPRILDLDVAWKVIRRVEEMVLTFETREDPRLLWRAIHLLNHIVPLLYHDSSLGRSLHLRACCHHWLFTLMHDTFLLDQCIEACQIALCLPEWGPNDRYATLRLCGRAHGARYENGNDIKDLDGGIESYRGALEELGEGVGRPPGIVTTLGSLLLQRHERRGNDSDLDDAMDLFREALSLFDVNEPRRPPCLTYLAITLLARHEKLGNISDVEEAIIHLRGALSLLTGNRPDHSFTLSHLARALATRYGRLGNISDIEEVVIHLREALSLLSATDELRPHCVTRLANALLARYGKLGNISDVEEAIVCHRETLSLLSDTHPNRPLSLNNLAESLRIRYGKLGDMSDLEEATVHLRDALSLIPVTDKLRATCLASLANSLCTRYETLGELSGVDEGIIHLQTALTLLDVTDELRPSCLNNLAITLRTRYRKLGYISDVEEAIVYHREALLLRPGSHPNRSSSLCNLASALYNRFERLGSISDLHEGLSLLKEALSMCHPDDPERSVYIHTLANQLWIRYETTDNVGDLNEAIRLFEDALAQRSGNHPLRPGTLQSLGKALLLRGQESDIEIGTAYIEESLSLSSTHSPDRQVALLTFLRESSRHNHQLTDRTVLHNRCIEAAKLTPPDHPDYCYMASISASVLLACDGAIPELLNALGLDPSLNTKDAILALAEKGSRSRASSARDRLSTACTWIKLSTSFERPHTLEMYSLMLEHLDLTVALGPSLDLRRQRLTDDVAIQTVREMVPDGVVFAIEQGAIETAIEFFEQGRSILLTQLSLYRGSSGLEMVAPDLARRFNGLSRELECATFTGDIALQDTKRPFEDPISRSARLKREWEQLVEEIRSLGGFANFLRPTPFSELQNVAAEGPIVLINISMSRSDAIIVTSQHPPIVVPLPEATPEHIESLVDLFAKVASPRYLIDARDPLRSLWEVIVEPVVLALEQIPDVTKGSRIWWCPSGAVTTLPLHAAGNYGTGGRRLPDLYISSYTPTLSALSRARQGRSEHSGPPSLLLVGQSHTPGFSSLPGVPKEITRVKKRIAHATVIEDENGTHDAVLSAVAQHQWVHLSCHGKIQTDNPLESHFALHDGPLTLFELMQKRLPHAELAFLSCCHSASGNSMIPDEFLHLAAGMQFAGFKSVIGTMWAMNDAVGPMLADEFYRMLLGRGKGDYRKSAKALSNALKILRREGVPAEIWINFVHWGA